MIRAVPARPLACWPEDEEPRFEQLGDAIDRLSTTLRPLVGGLVLPPAREGIRRWELLDGQITVLGDVRERLHEQGLCPAMLAATSRRPGGVVARAMAIHGIPSLGMPLALHRSEAMSIQLHATPHRNGMPAGDPGSFLRVLSQRLLTYAIQGLGHTEGSCPDNPRACHCGAGWRAAGWTWP